MIFRTKGYWPTPAKEIGVYYLYFQNHIFLKVRFYFSFQMFIEEKNKCELSIWRLQTFIKLGELLNL